MTDLIKGTLTWEGPARQPRAMISFQTRRGKTQKEPVMQGRLAPELAVPQPGEIEVDFEFVGGKPGRIRPAGSAWTEPVVAPPAPQRPSMARGRVVDGPRREPGAGTERQRLGEQFVGEFHNPYGFVPAPSRQPLLEGPLGDHPGPGHERWREGLYSGRIRVRLTTVTPLLLPDAARATEDKQTGHKTFPVRLGIDGRPYLPPTSIKGMLRSAFEAVTNSRYGVFAGNHRRLGYRLRVEQGLSLVPARVTGDELELFPGTNRDWAGGGRLDGGVRDHAVFAAWLPRYVPRKPGIGPTAARYIEDRACPKHGDGVQCLLRLYQHHRWVPRQKTHVADFLFWRVEAIMRANSATALPTAGDPPQTSKRDGSSWHKALPDTDTASGWVCITNQNIDRKHDERVFFSVPGNTKRAPLTLELRRGWTELIQDYRDLHFDAIHKRRSRQPPQGPEQYISHEPGSTAFSRHVYAEEDLNLTDGALVYAHLDQTGNPDALYPVMISRELYKVAPADLLLPEFKLRPTRDARTLSAADRVFGWVREGSGAGEAAYRGHLRVGAVQCEADDAVEFFPEAGMPLAILGAPKPAQGRFYLVDAQKGAVDGRNRPEAGYQPGNRIRGRKFFPHHRQLTAGYWREPWKDRTQEPEPGNGVTLFQEYRRPTPPDDERARGKRDRDDQNRSVTGWVKPGTTFAFDIDVTNLSRAELGALLWLLDLNVDVAEPRRYHRLGAGKPLGFGSVQIEIVGLPDLVTGDRLAEYYRDFSAARPHAAATDFNAAITTFKTIISDAYGAPFEEVPFICSFLTTATGFADDLPIHYPRVRADGMVGAVAPSWKGENFKWFQENEDQRGPRLALRDLGYEKGLPIYREGQFRPQRGSNVSGVRRSGTPIRGRPDWRSR